MEKYVDQNFAMNKYNTEIIQDGVIILCNFTNARFGKSQWSNCVFSDCQFNMALFEEAEFKNCTFKACEFINCDFMSSSFEDCFGYLSTFCGVNFSSCDFGFISTDMCLFRNTRIGHNCKLPASCREIVGEVISQISSDYEILAFSGIIRTYSEFCWDTLIKIGRSFMTPEGAEKVAIGLKKFPNFGSLLDKLDTRLLAKGE